MRKLRRLFCAVFASMAVLQILINFEIKTKLRHPGQLFIKLKTSVRIVEEQPDLSDELQETLHSSLCPKKPVGLVRTLTIDNTTKDLKAISQKYIPNRHGGHFKPRECVSRTKTAVIIPFRNREQHLRVLLNHLIPFLVRQQVEFNIFVVELESQVVFNKALLMNVGFVEALKVDNFTCFIFHDVDLLPESDYNLYRCGDTPRHMASVVSSFNYKIPTLAIPGGVTAVSRDIYEKVNGHSNLYFGWGGEDDDLLYRFAWKNYLISRYPIDVARYTAISHKRDPGNPVSNIRYKLLWTAEKRMLVDGLNSLKYKIVAIERLHLYTKILVEIDVNDYTHAIEEFT